MLAVTVLLRYDSIWSDLPPSRLIHDWFCWCFCRGGPPVTDSTQSLSKEMQSGKQDAEPSENASESKTLQKLPLELPSTGTLRFCGQECKTKAVLQIIDVGSSPTALDMSAQPETSNSCTTEEQSGKKHCHGIMSSLDTVADLPTTLCCEETNIPCVPNFTKQASSSHEQPGYKCVTAVSDFGSTDGQTSMTRDQLQPLKDRIKGSEHVKEQRSLIREVCLCPLTGCIMEDPVTAQVSPRKSYMHLSYLLM